MAIYLSGLLMVLMVTIGHKFEDDEVLQQDVVQYYSYVPATFIYGDLSMAYARTSPFWQDKIWGHMTQEGAYVQKYTMGLAIMYTPFFFAGHATAYLCGALADGYSWPYELWIQIGSIVYLFLGLLILRKLLLCYFSDQVTAITLLTLVLCTNLFYYSVGQGPMPHVYVFSLLSLFLYLTFRFHKTPTWILAFSLALTGGMIFLIRPNHFLVWMIPILYDLNRAKLQWWRRHWQKILVWPLGVLLVVTPQLIYWYHFTGEWVFYSYGEEGFFFDQPVFFKAWFGFRKGWLIYTPVMTLALAGMFRIHRITKEWVLPFAIFFIASTYVIVSWWCWWYGGSFGLRPFIDLFPVLSFGLASLLTTVYPKIRLFYSVLSLIAIFGVLNAFQTWQYTKGIIHYDSMTAAAYKATFGKISYPENYEELIKNPNYDKAVKGEGR